MLVRLLYASRAADPSPAAIEAIVAAARGSNTQRGVTGVLVYGSGVFLHALEGSRRAVSALFGQIQRDSRHTDVELLLMEDIDHRRFGAWAIGLVDVRRVNASTLLKYSTVPELDPYSVSGRSCMALLEDLAATAAIVGHI